jgi:hypothetical protein
MKKLNAYGDKYIETNFHMYIFSHYLHTEIHRSVHRQIH